MEKNEGKVLERNLEQKVFEDATKAIESGKEDGSLTDVELVENLIESYKGKTVQAPLEVIMISATFLNAGELTGLIEALKVIHRIKMVKEMISKGEVTAEDAMDAFILAAIMKKESEKINKHE